MTPAVLRSIRSLTRPGRRGSSYRIHGGFHTLRDAPGQRDVGHAAACGMRLIIVARDPIRQIVTGKVWVANVNNLLLENVGWGALAFGIAAYFVVLPALAAGSGKGALSVLRRMERHLTILFYFAFEAWMVSSAFSLFGIDSGGSQGQRTWAAVAIGWGAAGVAAGAVAISYRRRIWKATPVEQQINLSAKRNFFWYISRAFTYAFAVVVCTDAMLFGEMITVNIRAPLAGRLAWLGGGRALAVSALVFAAGYIYSLTLSGALVNILNRTLGSDWAIGRRWHFVLAGGPYLLSLTNAYLYPGLLTGAITFYSLLFIGYRWTDDAPCGAMGLLKSWRNRRERARIETLKLLPPGESLIEARRGSMIARMQGTRSVPVARREPMTFAYSSRSLLLVYGKRTIIAKLRALGPVMYQPPGIIEFQLHGREITVIRWRDANKPALLPAMRRFVIVREQYRAGQG
jgi:hypothetical protein